MKLWILSASTGGGHNMRANALKEWWNTQHGQARVYHPLEKTFFGYRFGCWLYNLIQKNLPRAHSLYFHFLERAAIHRGPRRILGRKNFLREYEKYAPHVVVSVHAHLNHGYFDMLRNSSDLKSKFSIYCGELAYSKGFSRHWVNPDVDAFWGPFEETCLAAQKHAMPAYKCLVAGPLLRKAFYKKPSANPWECLRDAYRISPNLPIYLLGTGANGVNQHAKVVRSFEKMSKPCQLVALCGENERIFRSLSERPDHSVVRVLPLPTIGDTEMALFLRISQFLFARPGAGITTEAISCGCPVVFDTTGGIMPQEQNNLNFWKKYADQLVTCSNPHRLGSIVDELKTIPRVYFPLNESPAILLDAIKNLIG